MRFWLARTLVLALDMIISTTTPFESYKVIDTVWALKNSANDLNFHQTMAWVKKELRGSAEQRGANAVVGCSFAVDRLNDGSIDISVVGTAVILNSPEVSERPLDPTTSDKVPVVPLNIPDLKRTYD